MAKITREAVVDYLHQMPVIELARLLRGLEGKWGVGAMPDGGFARAPRTALAPPSAGPLRGAGAALRAPRGALGGVLLMGAVACVAGAVGIHAMVAATRKGPGPLATSAPVAFATVASPEPPAPSATASVAPSRSFVDASIPTLEPSAAVLDASAAPAEPAPPADASAAPAEPAPPVADAFHARNDVTACVEPLFPAGSFDGSADLSFVCTEGDPIKGGTAVRVELVRTRRNLSEGMKEWALLGWYEMAAFTVIQARCCPALPRPKLPDERDPGPVGRGRRGAEEGRRRLHPRHLLHRAQRRGRLPARRQPAARRGHRTPALPQAGGGGAEVTGAATGPVGAAMNPTREQIRRAEARAQAGVEALEEMMDLRDFADERRLSTRSLPIFSVVEVDEEDEIELEGSWKRPAAAGLDRAS
jgi:hypothetical protein